MTDRFAAETPASPLSDDQIAAFVRDAADAWQMPPVRLPDGGWAAKVRGRRQPGHRAIGAARRLGQSLFVAMVLVIVAAAAGVWLTIRQNSGVSNVPVPSGPARGALAPTAIPTHLLVRLDRGYAVIDFEQVAVSQPIAADSPGALVRMLDDGTLACICPTADSTAVEWWHLDSSGAVLSSSTIETFHGDVDPRSTEPNAGVTSQINVSAGPGDLAYVGWSSREHPVWHSGVLTVDMTNGQILSRFDLPDRSDGTADSPMLVDGPRIAGSAGDGRVLIDRPRISWSPANSPSSYRYSHDAFLASSSGEKLDDAQPLDGIDYCDVDVISGSVNGGGWWLACNTSAGLRVRRFDDHDVPLGDTSIETTWLDASDLQATVAPDPSGRALFVWDPTSQDLTRLDLATGETTDGHGTRPTADLLSALGAWIEPAAAAKTIATPTITVSPDGTRVYALGFFQQPIDHGQTIPASGVSAFDATSLDLEWEAGGSDAHSIATNADGSLVLLATSTPAASIDAWIAASGVYQLSFDNLGYEPFYFTSPQLP